MSEVLELAAVESDAPKRKIPRAAAVAVCRELLAVLQPHLERVIVAGSLRRKKERVSDIEILYIPKLQRCKDLGDLFERPIETNVSAVLIDCLESAGYLAKRLSKTGVPTWGQHNKLAVHCRSEIPIDFFATTREKWWNSLVFRTGGKVTNVAIATAANELGWTWNPYGVGFSRGGPGTGRAFEEVQMMSEEEVFHHVRKLYLPPEQRK